MPPLSSRDGTTANLGSRPSTDRQVRPTPDHDCRDHWGLHHHRAHETGCRATQCLAATPSSSEPALFHPLSAPTRIRSHLCCISLGLTTHVPRPPTPSPSPIPTAPPPGCSYETTWGTPQHRGTKLASPCSPDQEWGTTKGPPLELPSDGRATAHHSLDLQCALCGPVAAAPFQELGDLLGCGHLPPAPFAARWPLSTA